MFFFEKKNQKDFFLLSAPQSPTARSIEKSLFASFASEKEESSLLSS